MGIEGDIIEQIEGVAKAAWGDESTNQSAVLALIPEHLPGFSFKSGAGEVILERWGEVPGGVCVSFVYSGADEVNETYHINFEGKMIKHVIPKGSPYLMSVYEAIYSPKDSWSNFVLAKVRELWLKR